MSKARVVHTHFIIELLDRGWKYHLTVPSDLKDIYEVDMLETGNGEQHDVIDLLNIVQDLFLKNELDLD
jgi:hypothetical protein